MNPKSETPVQDSLQAQTVLNETLSELQRILSRVRDAAEFHKEAKTLVKHVESAIGWLEKELGVKDVVAPTPDVTPAEAKTNEAKASESTTA